MLEEWKKRIDYNDLKNYIEIAFEEGMIKGTRSGED